jgi:cell wall-associated NlpC family hydrolase
MLIVAAAGFAAVAASAPRQGPPELLRQDVLINADLWDTKPRMMAAGLGFTNIVGVPGLTADDLTRSEALVRRAGGAWNPVDCSPGTSLAPWTSASTPQQVAVAYGGPIVNGDGLPVEFSWPVRPSTVDPSDFRVTLNTGDVVTPQLASIYPNAEYNERSVVVLFGRFGNRLPASDPKSVYPVKTAVVARLQLVGPHAHVVSAVGLAAKSIGSPYSEGQSGPRLVAAKLSRMSAEGDAAPAPFDGVLPNSGTAHYGAQARFRVRIYTTGGFSPDGVRAVLPTEFARYFRLHTRDTGGRDVVVSEANVDYSIGGGKLRVLGLADLGRASSTYDACYLEDKDNYIDIVLDGSAAAARRITSVEIPASGSYSPFYNPGGPGSSPTPGVRYTAPGPSQRQKVTIAIDDPMTVSFSPRP